MLLTTSCKKDVDLTGTTWNYSETTTETYEGMSMTITANADMIFTSETAGKIVVNSTANFMGQTMELENATTDFTYTFDGESAGTITSTVTNDNGETETETVNFTYDGEAETITVVDDDFTMVFNKK